MRRLRNEQRAIGFLPNRDIEHETREFRLLEIAIEACLSVNNLSDLKSLIRTQVRELLPHQVAACGIGQLHGRRVLRLVNIDYPDDYLQEIIHADQSIHSYVLDLWLCRREPTLVKLNELIEINDVDNPFNTWLQSARKHDLQHIAVHGLIESSGHTFSLFSFAQLNLYSINSYARILRILVPHLHAALTRTFTEDYLNATEDQRYPQTADANTSGSLSRREKEVLGWVSHGKTNWEIAQIMQLSEHTIKNHVRNILKKLGVINRLQAAGKLVK